MNVGFYLSYDIKITLKVSKGAKIRNQYNQVPHLTQDTNGIESHFRRKNVIILSLCTQRCYGRHSVFGKNVNHKWFFDAIAWRNYTP